MKYLKDFKIFENRQSDEEIHSLCKKYEIRNYTINPDGTIDVDSVDLYDKDLNKIPLNFNRVERYFDINNNNLTSLEGSPNYVLFNWYDIVRDEYTDQPKIVLQRLNTFLDQVGKDRVEKVPGYINI